MNTKKTKSISARILFSIGVIAMVVGMLDPLEGSVVILAGSGLVALGTWLGHKGRALSVYWAWLFGMITTGVIALFWMSAVGGIGGNSGHSLWWGLVLLPYPIGWLLGIANLVSRMIDSVRHRHAG
ncbi:MAG TPA: hypothetical protein VN784_05060 [Candidatus Limnocylindrales bacterium]|nr:hypothetical protein [Candidatus Limnocylindrales bacterium]